LDLSKFNLSTSSEEALLSILGQQAKLTWLDLRGLRLREAGYDQALTIMKQAKELEALILDCHGLDCALTDRILLEAIQLPQLRTLDLGKAQLSETAVAQALELLQKRTFPLSVNATTPEMCSDLREAINTWAREQKNSPIPRTIQCAAS
ncbi:MAG: hypothetical protein KDK78_08015, partial [Chlamydiia bacterium]|nr:hypothetical protein [Chlamydiia bacterium]